MPHRVRTPLLMVISAPSGGGKTTVCDALLREAPNLTRAITCTTRAPRDGERDGVDYYFLKDDDFVRKIELGGFMEHALVHGRRYGTLKSELLTKLASGRDVLLNIDVQGAQAMMEKAKEDPQLHRSLVSVFLTPLSLSVLEARLKRRGKDSPEEIHRRLATANQEIRCWDRFDYLVISTEIPEDLRRVQIIYEAEMMKQSRTQAPVLDGDPP
jgi:guanylate kinase